MKSKNKISKLEEDTDAIIRSIKLAKVIQQNSERRFETINDLGYYRIQGSMLTDLKDQAYFHHFNKRNSLANPDDTQNLLTNLNNYFITNSKIYLKELSQVLPDFLNPNNNLNSTLTLELFLDDAELNEYLQKQNKIWFRYVQTSFFTGLCFIPILHPVSVGLIAASVTAYASMKKQQLIHFNRLLQYSPAFQAQNPKESANRLQHSEYLETVLLENKETINDLVKNPITLNTNYPQKTLEDDMSSYTQLVSPAIKN